MRNKVISIPIHLNFVTGKVKWINLSNFPDLPFLDSHTIASLAKYTFETGFDELSRLASQTTKKKPAGFIFHTSRCGSTLISRVLQSSNTLVLNEPQPINALLVDCAGPNGSFASEQWEEMGDKMIGAVICSYLNTGLRIFINFSSFNLLLINRILARWENVPVLFLYRNPIEVAVSNLQSNGGFMRKRNNKQMDYILKECGVERPANLHNEEYCVRIINAYFQVIISHMQNSNICLKDYESINLDGIQYLADFFNIPLSSAIKNEILDCMNRDAKSGKIFTRDAADKHVKASRSVRNLCMDLAYPNYLILKEFERKIHGQLYPDLIQNSID